MFPIPDQKFECDPAVCPTIDFSHFSYYYLKWKIYGYSLKINHIVRLDLLFEVASIS
jgi:hypothetical protein